MNADVAQDLVLWGTLGAGPRMHASQALLVIEQRRTTIAYARLIDSHEAAWLYCSSLQQCFEAKDTLFRRHGYTRAGCHEPSNAKNRDQVHLQLVVLLLADTISCVISPACSFSAGEVFSLAFPFLPGRRANVPAVETLAVSRRFFLLAAVIEPWAVHSGLTPPPPK
jgi:hypothetical protein